MAAQDNTITEVLVGAAVMAVAVGFFVYASNSTGGGPSGGAYAMSASFRSADGISVGTEVRLAGVRVGTVTGMALNPQTFRAETTFTIRDDIELPDDSAIAISSEGLLGGNFVEIIPGGSPFSYAPGDQIMDTQGSVSLITLLMRFVTGDEGE
ncbi:outer membrane lipid asymmetry maintenance protein MlaD [Roseicyclus mahoneyensis]|uniref:Phospholipid/cholesterol/gamma-HCH transport system substrate-binding protein n=1 Tax=Roseicyclus mahoneyensis TaxID=164332 RepID=A0A316GHC3_9RHOB|nr:outer membrane lipid asymmetry maintenance protein MlaD [Roseicyclus mahoneyensis]PWK60473.1 phospholipid/cholesterol/gamma-HCH transport system substrate-binding protein [Roseicyclus mahoneyensis]